MVNSTLVDVIWNQRDLIDVSANILEAQIPEHLPVFLHGVLLYSDPINRHLGVIRVDDKRDFRKLQKEIQDFYQKNFASWQVELSEIAPQIYYVAKIGDNYYRCQVHSTKEKAGQFFVLVLLVDFGMFKKVLAQNLFNLNEEFAAGEWETARALCCTLPDDVSMFELKLPNYAVFKTEIKERAPVEVIILSFSNEQPHPCLAVIGSCMPDAFNTLNIDNYFLGKESRLFWMLKYLRGEHDLTEISWNDEIALEGDTHLNYAIQSSELTTDWSNVVLVKSKSADEIFVRTIASSLRLAFMQDLLNEQYSVINIKSMAFEKNQLKPGLPVVALHPDTNRLFRAQINWVSGDHNTVNVIGIDNPTFDFTMNYFQIYQLDQMFLVAPEVEHITLQSAEEIIEAWQHMNELINPGDVIKVQRLPRSNKTRLLFLDKEDKEEKDIVNTLNKLKINASIFKPKSAVHEPEIEIADTKTDNNAIRNNSYKLETVADHMFADGGLDYLTNFKHIYSPPMRKSLNGLDLYNRFDHTKPNVVSPSKHTVIRSPKSVKFNLEKIIVEMSPTQLNGMRPSRLMST